MPGWNKFEWEANKRWIRASVQSGIFRRERCVGFDANGQHYGLIVDESSVVCDCLEVYVIEPVDDQVIIQLPRDTFTTGRRIRIPWEMILTEPAGECCEGR